MSKKNTHAFLTRISSNEARSIATQVAVGILAETKTAIASVKRELKENLNEKQYKQVVAGMESTLASAGIRVAPDKKV